MTPVRLLEELKRYLEEVLKDMLLPVRMRTGTDEKERPLNVYLMNVPRKEDEVQQVPYILLKYVLGKDEQAQGSITSAEAKIRIIAIVYAENAEERAVALLNIIDRIRNHLLKDRELASQFSLKMPLEHIVYDDNTGPYYIGEIMSTWSMPSIEREVMV